MKSFAPTVLALAASISLASATPRSLKQRNDYGVEITLKGATDDVHDQYPVWVPFKTWTPTNNVLSISRVSYNHDGVYCEFIGVDEKTAPPVESNGQLGPPQTIEQIYCDDKPVSYKRDVIEKRNSISIVLRGATDDPADRYYISVFDDGTPTYPDNSKPLYRTIPKVDFTNSDTALGISLAEYDFNTYDCVFHGINSDAVPSNPVPDPTYGPWIQLGPPQTIESVECHCK